MAFLKCSKCLSVLFCICIMMLCQLILINFNSDNIPVIENVEDRNDRMDGFCNIIVAHGPDRSAYTATAIWTYPINYLLYAESKNSTLWIDYKNKWNHKNYDPMMKSENCFEYFCESIEPISQGCNINISNIIHLTYDFITFLQYRSPISVRNWYYGWYVPKDLERYDPNWYYNHRVNGNRMVSEYFKYRRNITNEVTRIWIDYFGDNSIKYEILGVQMRGTDKAARRRKVSAEEYLVYIHAFIQYYGVEKAKIFIATDDSNMLKFIMDNFKYNQKQNNILFTQRNIQRSNSSKAILRLPGISRYQVGKAVIIDILLLSKCDWFIHSASAVVEAVFYNNLKLHNKSVNLEYLTGRSIPVWFNHF